MTAVVEPVQEFLHHREDLEATIELLEEHEDAEVHSELAKIYSEKGQIGWGHAIRSYFLYPEQRVKDAWTGETTSNTQGVLDGEIQWFIDAELRRRAAAKHK